MESSLFGTQIRMAARGHGEGNMDIAEYCNRQNTYNIKHRMLDSNDIITENTGSGYRLNLSSKNESTVNATSTTNEVVPCLITEINDDTYTVEVYGNGKSETKTADGFMDVSAILIDGHYLIGDWILGFERFITT